MVPYQLNCRHQKLGSHERQGRGRMIEYGKRWPARGLYLAFNRSIADEAQRKFHGSIETRTEHSFAYRAPVSAVRWL